MAGTECRFACVHCYVTFAALCLVCDLIIGAMFLWKVTSLFEENERITTGFEKQRCILHGIVYGYGPE